MKYEATSQTRKMGMLAAMIALLTLVYIFGASPVRRGRPVPSRPRGATAP